MRKLLLIIICIFAFVSVSSGGLQDQQRVVIAKRNAAACTKDTSNLVMDETAFDEDAYRNLSLSDAHSQSFQYGSGFILWSFAMDMQSGTDADCRFTVRIGPGADLTTVYYEEWTGINPGAGGGLVEVVSVDQDSCAADTPYFIGALKTAGVCRWVIDNANPYADGAMYGVDTSGWNTGTINADKDYHLSVYKTTVTPCE